jgi:hypothetical protein
MRNKIGLVGCLALLGLNAGQAATTFPDGMIPVELAQEFSTYGEIYSSLPDNFPLANLKLDVDLQVIGSVLPSDFSSQVLLRSNSSADAIAMDLAPALLDSGWMVMNSSTTPGSRFATLCHAQLGDLGLIARDRPEGGSRLSVRLTHRETDCDAEKARLEQSSALRELLNARFPRLTLPSGAGIPGLDLTEPGPATISSLYFIQRSGIAIAPNGDAAELYEHFAAQLREQGWSEDSGGSGALTASGFWQGRAAIDTSAPGGATLLLTALTVVDRGWGHEVTLTMEPLTGIP